MSSPSGRLTITLAGIGVTINCPASEWRAHLEKRYRLFMGGGSPVLTLKVRTCSHTQPDADDQDGLSFQGDTTFLRSQTYYGTIKSAQKLAEICTSDKHPIEDIDYFLRVTYAFLAFQAGGLLFHAAGIAHRKKGFLFFGHSGAGKTTVARFSPGDRVLNDDLVILMPSQPSGLKASKLAGEKSPPGAADHIPWSIHSTPFWNPSQVKPDHSSIELAAMFHLVQDKRVYLEPLSAGQSTAELVASIPVIPRDPRIGASLIDRLERLQAHAPVFNLHFLPDASFWRVIDELSLN